MDYGYENGYDYVWKVDADIIMSKNSLDIYLFPMNDNVFAVYARAIDFIQGPNSAGGTFLFNMNLLKNKYRYKYNLYPDASFVDRVKAETGWEHIRQGIDVAIHHPIYTPFTIYRKIRVALSKYSDKSWYVDIYKRFLYRGIKSYPDNITIKVGMDILHKILENPKSEIWKLNDNDFSVLKKEWDIFKKSYMLDGSEFYAMHGWENIAKTILNEGVNIPNNIGRVVDG